MKEENEIKSTFFERPPNFDLLMKHHVMPDLLHDINEREEVLIVTANSEFKELRIVVSGLAKEYTKEYVRLLINIHECYAMIKEQAEIFKRL